MDRNLWRYFRSKYVCQELLIPVLNIAEDSLRQTFEQCENATVTMSEMNRQDDGEIERVKGDACTLIKQIMVRDTCIARLESELLASKQQLVFHTTDIRRLKQEASTSALQKRRDDDVIAVLKSEMQTWKQQRSLRDTEIDRLTDDLDTSLHHRQQTNEEIKRLNTELNYLKSALSDASSAADGHEKGNDEQINVVNAPNEPLQAQMSLHTDIMTTYICALYEVDNIEPNLVAEMTELFNSSMSCPGEEFQASRHVKSLIILNPQSAVKAPSFDTAFNLWIAAKYAKTSLLGIDVFF